MIPRPPTAGKFNELLSVARRNRLTLIILLILSLSITSWLWLKGQLGSFPVLQPTVWTTTYDPSFPRSCSSVGTLLQYRRAPLAVRQFYVATVSDIVSERETLLSNPALWNCSTGQGPPMPRLKQLADALPGWYDYDVALLPNSPYRQKPVTFDAFAAILGEFTREYECKLKEMKGQAYVLAEQGLNFDGPHTPPADVLSRNLWAATLMEEFDDEQRRTRTAVERTLLTLRSYELSYPLNHKMSCLTRAALDLKNGLALAADAVSCMPGRVWDKVGSIYDRASSSSASP